MHVNEFVNYDFEIKWGRNSEKHVNKLEELQCILNLSRQVEKDLFGDAL